MRIFWWQEGLHFEPESKEERQALALLLDGLKFTSIGADPLLESTGIICQQLAVGGVSDLQTDPSSLRAVEKFAD
jgi:hypothetical protein